MTEIAIPKVFQPLFKRDTWRYKVFYGGRGGAKSHGFARALLVMGSMEPLRIICAREFQKSIKDSVHKLLADIIRADKVLSNCYEILESTIRGRAGMPAAGTEFIFVGLKHNITGIKSLEGADIVWVEESENVSDNSWEVLIPTVRKPRSEIWISFNTKNINDPTYRRFVATSDPEILCVKVSWRDNPFFPDVLRKEMERLAANDPEAHAHIWEGEPDTRRSGAVYAKQIGKAREEGRICRVPYDPAFEVFAAADLGFADTTAIWWLQFVGRELRWLSCHENSGEQLEYYARYYKAKPYNYMKRGLYLPHDGAAGNIRGESVTGQFTKMGVDNQVLPIAEVAAGIELLRQVLAYSVFDEEGCKEGLHALENYAYEWDEDKQVFKNKPLHNWASNYADAARYAAHAVQKIKGNLTESPKHAYRQPTVHWMG